MSEVRLTIHDCRRVGFCVAGVRRQCATLGVDFRRLVREGIPESELSDFEDLNIERALDVARERVAADG